MEKYNALDALFNTLEAPISIPAAFPTWNEEAGIDDFQLPDGRWLFGSASALIPGRTSSSTENEPPDAAADPFNLKLLQSTVLRPIRPEDENYFTDKEKNNVGYMFADKAGIFRMYFVDASSIIPILKEVSKVVPEIRPILGAARGAGGPAQFEGGAVLHLVLRDQDAGKLPALSGTVLAPHPRARSRRFAR